MAKKNVNTVTIEVVDTLKPKRAVGHPVVHNKSLIARKLVEWAQLDTSINLNGFCISLDPPLAPQNLTAFAHVNKELQEALSIAKAFVSCRRENKLSSGLLHTRAYELNSAVYDFFLKQHRREQAEFDAQLKAEIEMKNKAHIPENDDKLNAIIDGLKENGAKPEANT